MSISYVIHCGKLYDGLKAELQGNMKIWVENDIIREIGPAVNAPAAAQVIDLSGMTVTPGMIDAHVHPQFFDWHDVYADTIYNSDGYRALATGNTARKCLLGGFTTIRAMGWFRESFDLDVKRAIEQGHLDGARLVVAPHLLGAPGSHGDMTQVARSNPVLSDFLQSIYPGTGTGADFFTNAVRREVKLGADFIKIMATGGFSTPNDGPEDIQLNDAELEAIFTTAKALSITVTAHAYGPELIQKLVRMGIDGIEHGSLMDHETARLMEQNGVYLVPTFMPYEDAVNPDPVSIAKKSPEFQRKLGIYQKRLQEGRRIIIDSKIKLGYGTDFVTVHNPYENGWEYHSWMSNGVDPFRTLAAATKSNAEICQVDHLTGTLEPGKQADIAGWQRDLMTDPYALLDCGFVMKGGMVYATECRLPPAIAP